MAGPRASVVPCLLGRRMVSNVSGHRNALLTIRSLENDLAILEASAAA